MSRLGSLLVVVVAFAVHAPSARAQRCADVQKAIDAQVSPATAPQVLLRLGPHFSPRALAGLLKLGSNPGAFFRRLAAFGAFGLARHAEGLRRIARSSAPSDADGRVAFALASVALGEDTYTSTITATIDSAQVLRRRGVIQVLSRMRHARPRVMLRAGLSDPDPEVRLTAAEALIRFRNRDARAALVDLLKSGPDAIRARAVEALIEVGHRFESTQLRALPPDTAARAYARVRGRRPRLSRLKAEVAQADHGLRAGVLAAVAARSDASPTWLRRSCPRWKRRYGSLGAGEIAMTGALLGDPEAQDSLAALAGEARLGALRVLAAFAEMPSAETRIDSRTAQRVAAGLEPWWVDLTERDRARLMRSAGLIDAPTGVGLARRHLATASGEALMEAAEILALHGTVDDAMALVEAVKGPSDPAHGATLAAAARLCRLEAE